MLLKLKQSALVFLLLYYLPQISASSPCKPCDMEAFPGPADSILVQRCGSDTVINVEIKFGDYPKPEDYNYEKPAYIDPWSPYAIPSQTLNQNPSTETKSTDDVGSFLAWKKRQTFV